MDAEKTLLQSKKVFGKASGEKHKPARKEKNNNQRVTQPVVQNGTKVEEEEHDLQDMLDMIDDEDKELLMGLDKSTKRKREDDDMQEDDTGGFERQHRKDGVEAASKRRTVELLPIKTKDGSVITRSTEIEIEDNVSGNFDEGSDDEEDGEEEVIDSDDDVINDDAVSGKQTILFDKH